MSASCASSWLFSGSGILFHSGQGVQALGFLLPQTFVLSRIFLHVFLSISHSIMAVWALSVNCSSDVFLWSLTLVAVNFGQTVFLTWKNWPHNLPDDVMELFHKKFDSYGLSVGDMAVIVKGSTVECGGQEDTLVWNDDPKSLSFLLSGRLVACFGDLKLHHVEPFQCVNSVEWRAGGNRLQNMEYGANSVGWNFGENSPQILQNVECGILQCVSSQQWKKGFRSQIKYSVEKPYKILHLPTSNLEELPVSRPDLARTLDCIIGRDIVQKLKDSGNNNNSHKQSQAHIKNGICSL